MQYGFLGMCYGGSSPQWEHTNTKWVKLCLMGLQSSYDRMVVGSMTRDLAPYLVLLGDVLLVVLLHLPELGLQAAELDLHLLHVLQVPLGSLVQHLDGLGHVLDLRRQIGLSIEIHLYF